MSTIIHFTGTDKEMHVDEDVDTVADFWSASGDDAFEVHKGENRILVNPKLVTHFHAPLVMGVEEVRIEAL